MDRNARLRIALAALGLSLSACDDQSSPEASAPADAKSEAPAAGEPAPTPEAVPDAAPEPEPEPEPPPPSGHAVARVGASLFDSSTGAAGFEVPPLGTGPTASAGVTVNVVGRKDDRLEVETLVASPSEHHCAGTLTGLSDFRLRLYVAEADLVPVVTTEVFEEYEDGTSVRLAKGVPVPKDSGGRILAGETPVQITVPTESVGSYYEPGTPFARAGGDTTQGPPPGVSLKYAGTHPLEKNALYGGGDAATLYAIAKRESDTLVTVRNPCLEVVASVTKLGPVIPKMARSFDPDMAKRRAGILGILAAEGAASGGFGTEGGGVDYSVKAGTAIVWPDGKPAGQVTADHEFGGEPREQGGNSCFDVPLGLESTPSILLCASPGDVTKTERPVVAGIGGLGLVGTGSGSSGVGLGGFGRSSGSSAGFGGGGKRVPRVRQAKAAVKGSLDKDIIRRIVRAHINEVRYCYNQGLAKEPALEGRVAIKFTIGAKGKVTEATVESDSLSDDKVGKCIAKAVKRWKFPKPTGGGVVTVTYPFVLSPG